MNLEKEQIGFVRYSGKLVEDGFMDARKSAQALIGFDEAVRFFLYQQAPDLKLEEFEFPVKVKQGSWEIVVSAAAVIFTAYGVKAATKMAEKDFNDVGMIDLYKKAIKGLQWIIKIGKHLGDLSTKIFSNAKFKDNNRLIGIQNSDGEYLYVPKEFLEMYIATTPSILTKLSELVEDERTLSIGVNDGETIIEETVTTKYRRVFTCKKNDEDLQVLPELIHGQRVMLDAEITRGNEMSNTIGVQYGGHILTGIPVEGSIVRFKPNLFLKCHVHGQVLREDESKRPKILVDRIESKKNIGDLFDDDM